jgi:hypothetical protein
MVSNTIAASLNDIGNLHTEIKNNYNNINIIINDIKSDINIIQFKQKTQSKMRV